MSEVHVVAEGAFVFVDTKSMSFPAMVRTMVRLLVESLLTAEVAGHIAPAGLLDGAMLERSTLYEDEPRAV